MTSQLNVDTIVDKAGSGGTNVKIGNTSTYVADGGSASQNTVQSLAKHWVYFSMEGASFSDSFNSSSLTDDATGDFLVDITSAFSNTNYAIQFSANCYAANTWEVNQSVNAKMNWGVTNTTSKYDTASYANGNYIDSRYCYSLGHGDLA